MTPEKAYLQSVKGHNFDQMPNRVMTLSQIVELKMVNKCVKIYIIRLFLTVWMLCPNMMEKSTISKSKMA